MQHYKIKTSGWMCAATSFFVSSTVHAAIPPINITLSSGSNVISVAPGQTATVEYLIQDVIGRPPARTWLWNAPIPAYMSRTASLHQPDCSVYNQNPAVSNSFVLPPNGFCYFAMEVNGTILASQTTSTTTYKPLFSNSGAIAYGPCSPLQVTPIPTPPIVTGILLSAGSYLDSFGRTRPLLVSSRDEGTTWIYPESIPAIPGTIPFSNNGKITGTACTGATCVAAGQGEDLGLEPVPLLSVSQDAGVTWNYVLSADAPIFTPVNAHPYANGALLSTSCSLNTCIAGGDYLDTTLSERPFLAVSMDKGITWTYPTSITEPVFVPGNPNPYVGSGAFSSVSCSGSLCIAAGDYQSNSPILFPMVALSQDAGATWTYPASVTEVTVTPAFTGGGLSSASCSGNICVAGGSYEDITPVQRPLLVFTNDAGNTWTYSNDVTAPTLTPALTAGGFNGVSCNGNNCIAAGFYNDSLGISHPLLAVSQNGGVTWTFPSNISLPVFTPTNTHPFASGNFIGASCSADVCIAVGTYTDNAGTPVTRPLLAMSQDGGVTWSFPDIITSPTFVPTSTNPFVSGGVLNAASCDQNTCIASGSYTSTAGVQRPLIVISTDAGTTWTYPDVITSPTFTPTDALPFSNNGQFFAATAVSAPAYLPEQLQFLYRKQELFRH